VVLRCNFDVVWACSRVLSDRFLSALSKNSLLCLFSPFNLNLTDRLLSSCGSGWLNLFERRLSRKKIWLPEVIYKIWTRGLPAWRFFGQGLIGVGKRAFAFLSGENGGEVNTHHGREIEHCFLLRLYIKSAFLAKSIRIAFIILGFLCQSERFVVDAGFYGFWRSSLFERCATGSNQTHQRSMVWFDVVTFGFLMGGKCMGIFSLSFADVAFVVGSF